jgi:hypothetical protein
VLELKFHKPIPQYTFGNTNPIDVFAYSGVGPFRVLKTMRYETPVAQIPRTVATNRCLLPYKWSIKSRRRPLSFTDFRQLINKKVKLTSKRKRPDVVFVKKVQPTRIPNKKDVENVEILGSRTKQSAANASESDWLREISSNGNEDQNGQLPSIRSANNTALFRDLNDSAFSRRRIIKANKQTAKNVGEK